MNELVEKWTVERAWLQQVLEHLETGKIHIGNPWEGRAPAKIADLRHKISVLHQLIETEDTRESRGKSHPLPVGSR